MPESDWAVQRRTFCGKASKDRQNRWTSALGSDPPCLSRMRQAPTCRLWAPGCLSMTRGPRVVQYPSELR